MGCGAVGVMVAEMLARSGIGVVNLYDRDLVSRADLARMFFRSQMVGWSKTQAAENFLTDVNADVEINAFSYDVCLRFEDFVSSLRRGGNDPVDLVRSCMSTCTCTWHSADKHTTGVFSHTPQTPPPCTGDLLRG